MTKQEFLAMSLPYGLKCKELGLNEIFTLNPKLYSLIELLNWSNVYQPLLLPLSDLTKEIEYKGEKFVPIDILRKINDGDNIYISEWGVSIDNGYAEDYNLMIAHSFIQKLIEWHFDIFGGIESGEAINVNTLEINPYK